MDNCSLSEGLRANHPLEPKTFTDPSAIAYTYSILKSSRTAVMNLTPYVHLLKTSSSILIPQKTHSLFHSFSPFLFVWCSQIVPWRGLSSDISGCTYYISFNVLHTCHGRSSCNPRLPSECSKNSFYIGLTSDSAVNATRLSVLLGKGMLLRK